MDLVSLFTNIADAIRGKKGTEDKIRAVDFASEIESISSGGFDTSQMRRCNYLFQNNNVMTEAPYFDTSNVTDMSGMFHGCGELVNIPDYNTPNLVTIGDMCYLCSKLINAPNLNTSKVYYMRQTFMYCYKLKNVPQYDTSNVTEMYRCFMSCSDLQTIPLFDCSKVNSIREVIHNCYKLENVGGFKNLGIAYTSKTSNYSNYTLRADSCNNLTHESLMNIINNLYDLNLTYDVANGGILYTQTLQLGADNIAKLTAEEIAIATNKGWTVS